MNAKQWLPLIGLTISVFIFNMSEFMPIGVLTDIATDLSVSESQAGLIISFYAWAVALLSLPLMLLLRKMEYKRMLLLAVFLFMVFQFLSGISNSYWMLMGARIGVAVAHSIFWSIAAPLAVRVVEERYQRFALSVMAVGTSIAMILGLPAGRMIGLAFGWRMSFFTIAAISVMVLMLLLAVFPRLENPGTFTVKRMPDIYRNKVLVGLYIAVAVFVTGHFTAYSYIEPFLLQVAGFSEGLVTYTLIAFGIAGIIGSMIFSKFYEKLRYVMMPVVFLCAMLMLFLMRAVTSYEVVLIIVCSVWGMCYTLFCVTGQNEVLRASPADATAIAMSLQSGIFNVGIAMGSIVGGLVTDHLDIADIGLVGGLFAAVAAVFVIAFLIKWIKESETARGS